MIYRPAGETTGRAGTRSELRWPYRDSHLTTPFAFALPVFCSYKQTIGLDFFIKQLVLPNDIHVAVQVRLDPS